MQRVLSPRHDALLSAVQQLSVLQGKIPVGAKRQTERCETFFLQAFRYSLRSNTRPGRAPVGAPFCQTMAPLTITLWMPREGNVEC